MQIFGVIFFSCFNEVFNYILLLYLMRKAVVSKAAVYGALSSLFVIVYGMLVEFYQWQEYVETLMFFICYVILFFERRREKYKPANLNKNQ